jgi:hypothetical protein
MTALFSKRSQTVALLSIVWLVITLLSEIIFYFLDISALVMCPIFVIHLLWVLSVCFMLHEDISANLRKANLVAAIAPNIMFVLFMLSLILTDYIGTFIPLQELYYGCVKHVYRTTTFGKVCNIIEYGTGGLFVLSYTISIIVWLFNTYTVLRGNKLIHITNIFNLDKY